MLRTEWLLQRILSPHCSKLFMQDSPTARELIEAVTQFLNTEIAPTLADPRLKFRALVAANVLTIVGRELDIGAVQASAEQARLVGLLGDAVTQENVSANVERMTQELAQKIRAGEADDGPFHDAVFAHIEQTVTEKLQIANPKYLERLLKESANNANNTNQNS